MMHRDSEFPRTLVFGTGLTGGVLLALAAQVLLSQFGLDLAAAWQGLFVARAAEMRSAFAWWVLAGISFVSGFVIAALTRIIAENWWRLRALRWVAGAAMVAGLAVTGHFGGPSRDLAMAETVGVTLAAIVLSAAMATFGAYFASRR
jgi:hypothetical protein